MSQRNRVRSYFIAYVGFVLASAGCGSKSEPTEPPPSQYVPPPTPKTDLSSLVRKLKSNSPTARADAVAEFETRARTEPEIVSALVEAANDPSNRGAGAVFPNDLNSTREAVVVALLKCGPKGEQAFAEKVLPVLTKALTDAQPAVREHAAVAIGRAGKRSEAVVPELWKAVADDNIAVRGAAYNALLAIKPDSSEPLPKLLAHENEPVRDHAAEMLSRFGPYSDESLPDLIAALGSDDSFVRSNAAAALIPFGVRASPAIPELIAAMKKVQLSELQKQEPIELSPMKALAAIGEAAVAPTTKLLSDPSPLIRYQAAFALGEIGSPAKPALPELEKLLRDPSPEVALEGARAVAVVGGGASKSSALIKLALSHPEPATRIYGLNTVTRMGEVGTELAPLVLPLIDDLFPEVRRVAIAYVGTLDSDTAKPAVDVLAKRLGSDADETVRKEIVDVLGELGATSGSAGEALAKTAARDDALVVRQAAVDALIAIGPAAKGAEAGLATLVADTNANEELRAKAVTALARVTAESPEAVRAAMTDRSALVRAAAASAIGTYSKPDDATILTLGELAGKDTNPGVQAAALRSIAELGPKAAAVRSRIEPLTTARGDTIALLAKVAIARIDEKPATVKTAVRNGLTSRSTGERQAAAESLPLLGSASPEDVQALLGYLVDSSAIMRRLGIDSLRRLGREARPAVPRLLEVVESDPDAEVRRAAATALGATDDVSTEVVAALRAAESTDPAVARAARASLRTLGVRKTPPSD